MINFYPRKIGFWEWLRLLLTGRTVYLAVQLNAIGQPEGVQIVTRAPKGAQPLTQEATAAQQRHFQEAQAQLAKQQEVEADQGGTGRYAGRKGRKGRR